MAADGPDANSEGPCPTLAIHAWPPKEAASQRGPDPTANRRDGPDRLRPSAERTGRVMFMTVVGIATHTIAPNADPRKPNQRSASRAEPVPRARVTPDPRSPSPTNGGLSRARSAQANTHRARAREQVAAPAERSRSTIAELSCIPRRLDLSRYQEPQNRRPAN